MKFVGYNLGFSSDGLNLIEEEKRLKSIAKENGLLHIIENYEKVISEANYNPTMHNIDVYIPDFGQNVIGYRWKTKQYVFCQYLGHLWGLSNGKTIPKGAIKQWFPIPVASQQKGEKTENEHL